MKLKNYSNEKVSSNAALFVYTIKIYSTNKTTPGPRKAAKQLKDNEQVDEKDVIRLLDPTRSRNIS